MIYSCSMIVMLLMFPHKFFLLESREGIAGRLNSEIDLRPRSFCRSW